MKLIAFNRGKAISAAPIWMGKIRKTTQKRRHNQKEYHQKGVGSDDHIVDATHKGKSQLYANSHRKEGAIDASVNSKEEIEAAHLFRIG
jgi:hypothetical protein